MGPLMTIRKSMPVLCSLIVVLALAGQAFDAGAQQQEDKRAKEALRRLQLQQREFNEQKSKLEQDKADLEKNLAEKDKQGKSLQARVKKAEAGAKQSEGELKEKDAEIEALRTELEVANLKFVEARERGDKLADSYKASLETIKIRDEEKGIANSRINVQREILARQVQLIQTCEDKNTALYKVGTDLLGRYRGKGVVDALKQAEPFTQIERVRVENLWQEYHDKLDSAKVERPLVLR
jgi:chromosome segregation ATPase